MTYRVSPSGFVGDSKFTHTFTSKFNMKFLLYRPSVVHILQSFILIPALLVAVSTPRYLILRQNIS